MAVVGGGFWVWSEGVWGGLCRALARAARQGLGEKVRWVTVYFGQLTGGKFREKGTLCKKARGTMVRDMAQHQITDVEALKEFDGLGFQFWPEASDDQRLYFLLL